MTEKLNETQISRRKFLKTTTLTLTGGAVAFGGISVVAFKKDQLQLRPPGALAEELFLASCIKCGQCLQVCPPQVVKLAGISQGFGIGTPYIVPREGACILCSGLPCVLACPTGALDHALSLGKDASMGLAVLTNPDTCLSILGVNDLIYQLKNLQKNKKTSLDQIQLKEILTSLIKRMSENEKKTWQKKFVLKDISENTLMEGVKKIKKMDLQWIINFVSSSGQARTACQVCLDECPIKDEKPIVFLRKTDAETGRDYIYPSVSKTCVGCGVCEQKCPTTIASIKITPRLEWSKNIT
ncbi:MAG: 4Fe-4S dicluster domain-containing protein [Desulfobacteraceae bacterium]|nr:4Fe-4S dicluster domain-containing protein [Desulfobacteraceae bacterium]